MYNTPKYSSFVLLLISESAHVREGCGGRHCELKNQYSKNNFSKATTLAINYLYCQIFLKYLREKLANPNLRRNKGSRVTAEDRKVTSTVPQHIVWNGVSIWSCHWYIFMQTLLL